MAAKKKHQVKESVIDVFFANKRLIPNYGRWDDVAMIQPGEKERLKTEN